MLIPCMLSRCFRGVILAAQLFASKVGSNRKTRLVISLGMLVDLMETKLRVL